MGYQVLARKWRPNQFSQLVGQEHVVTAISNALANNRLHHAYLFTGTRGVGKTTIARIFSKSLNCEKGMSATPCGQCHTCLDIEQGNYVDLLEIDAASRTKVEDTRELLDNVQYKPTRGQFKVYLIDEVHMLSKHSFNALLKTLEEPPPHVKFLLATTDPQKLPVTILSRCLQFNLKALSSEQIVGQLSHILQQEQIEFTPAALQLLARAAQGSMRDALSLTDQAIAQSNGKVFESVVSDMLGLMDKNQILKLVHALFTKQSDALMEQVEHISTQAPDYSQLLSEILSLLHQVALTQFVPEACKLETVSAKAVYQLAKLLPPEQVQLCYQIALQGRKDLTHAADGRSGLEMTLLRMMAFSPDPLPLDLEDFQQLSREQGQVVTPVAKPVVSQQPKVETQPAPSETVQSNEAAPQEKVELQHNKDEDDAQVASALDAQQQDILAQAESLVPAENRVSVPDTQSQADEVDFDLQNDMMFDMQGDDDYAVDHFHAEPQNEPAPKQNEPVETAQQAPSLLDRTQSLLALKEKLSQHTDTEEGAPQAVKKSERPESDKSILPLRRPTAPPIAAAVSPKQSEVADSAPAAPDTPESKPEPISIDEQSHNEIDSGQPELSASTVLSSSSEVLDAPPWQVDDVESVDLQSDEPIPFQEEPQTTSEFDPNSHLEEQVNVPVDFEVPAFLEDGQKVVHAKQLDTWSQLIEQMEITALTKQLALHSAYEKQGNRVTLQLLDSKLHLDTESARQQLTQALSNVLQQDIELQVVPTSPRNTPYAVQQRINQVRVEHAQHLVKTDENIGRLIETFSATVVPDSIKPR